MKELTLLAGAGRALIESPDELFPFAGVSAERMADQVVILLREVHGTQNETEGILETWKR